MTRCLITLSLVVLAAPLAAQPTRTSYELRFYQGGATPTSSLTLFFGRIPPVPRRDSASVCDAPARRGDVV
jgi:hypothetical protein